MPTIFFTYYFISYTFKVSKQVISNTISLTKCEWILDTRVNSAHTASETDITKVGRLVDCHFVFV